MAAQGRKVPRTFGTYKRGKKLGSGAFAQVFACTEDEEKVFAVKVLDVRAMRLSGRSERELQKLQREARILKNLQPHPNVVQFVDIVEEDDWMFFVLEYVHGRTLFEVLTKKGSEPLSERDVRSIIQQIVEGVKHLHSESIIHRDLKLENVLVEGRGVKNLHVKIADFGLSKEVGPEFSRALSTVGTPKYIAPEVLIRGEHDFKADLWSLGILMFVLISGRFPFNGNEEAAKVGQDKIDIEVLSLKVSEQARSVLCGLLQLQAPERLSIVELCSHEWFRDHGEAAASSKRRRVGVRSEATGGVENEEAEQRSASSTTAPRAILIEDDQLPLIRQFTWQDCANEGQIEAKFKEFESKVRRLIEMGFDERKARNALEATNWSVDSAAQLLCE